MGYVDIKIPGIAYGAAIISEVGLAGQFVKMDASNSVALCTGGVAEDAVGLLQKNVDAEDVAAEKKAVVLMGGGIYETDAYTEGIAFGERLGIDETTKLLQTDAGTDIIVAECIAVEGTAGSGGVLTFKLLI